VKGRLLRRPEFIARQASNPSGIVGRLLFRVMAAETVAVNERTLELLAPEPRARILEVGFGHGRTLVRAAELAPKGFVAGIDISADLVRSFESRNRRPIAQGLIEVKLASSDRIPYPDAHFDRAYAVHTLYFWNNPLLHLGEIYRVTRRAADLSSPLTPKEDLHAVASFPATVYRFYSIAETRKFFCEVGFKHVEIVREPVASRDTVFAVAYR
jgi:ubiquinone/menaquinone biosynthesis C-methylase UbiE